MSEKQFTIADMINAARAESPSEFETAFNSMIVDRVADVVDVAKEVIARDYFNADEEQSSEEEKEETPDENIEADIGSGEEA
jgi:hypothetical protein